MRLNKNVPKCIPNVNKKSISVFPIQSVLYSYFIFIKPEIVNNKVTITKLFRMS